MHLFSGFDFPYTKDFLISLTMRSIARNAMHTLRRAPPLTAGILLRICKVLEYLNNPVSCTLFCRYIIYLHSFY